LVGQLDVGASKQRAKMAEVKQYMRDKKLAKATQKKIVKYYDQYLTQKSAFDEVRILAELSDTLRQEVVMFLNADIIQSISLFKDQDDGFITYVMSLMRPEYASANDYVFREGEIGKAMYFLYRGMVEVLGGFGKDMERYTLLEQVRIRNFPNSSLKHRVLNMSILRVHFSAKLQF
jgi:hypothetical protein